MLKIFVISVILSIVGGILLMGMGAIVPLTITVILENPLTFFNKFIEKIDKLIPSGDHGWPVAVLLALIWPLSILTTYYLHCYLEKYYLNSSSYLLQLLISLFIFFIQNYLLVKLLKIM